MANVPPELMALMQKGGGNAPPGAPGAGMGGGPVSAPMSTPQPNEGEKHAAMSQVQMAIDLLEQTLAPFGSETDEGQAILAALKTLSSKFGDKKEKARGLIPSEIMNLVSSLPKGMAPPGGGQQPPQPGMPPQGGAPQPPMM